MNCAGIIREMKTYAKCLMTPRHLPEVKFVIFGAGRSGTTLLVSLLDSHPRICCEDEILHHRVCFPRLYIRCRSMIAGRDVYGFKLLSYQLKNVQQVRDPRRFLSGLSESGYEIIYVKRRNALRHALSNLYARHRGRFHQKSTNGFLELPKMHVDLDELVRWMTGIEKVDEFEEGILQGVPHMDIVYEDDLQEGDCHQMTVDKIVVHLDIPSAAVRTDLVKVTPRTLSEFVANHKELERFVLETGYGGFLAT